MTGTAAHAPEPAGHWPARHRELLDGLTRHLDPDAGLRDIMLHADHAGLTGTLTGHLDTHAGLAAILPPPPAAAPRKTPGQPGTAAAITAADPAARIALRRSPVIRAVILSDLTVRALTIASKVFARPPAGDLAGDLASELVRDLVLARDLASQSIRARARFLVSALALDRASARDLAIDLAVARDLAIDLAVAFARELELDLASDLTLDRASDLVSDFARDRALAMELARALARARNLEREIALTVGDALGLRQVEGLAAALLKGALDDFTHTDLARADLTGRDLTGIRWSEQGTTWPPGINTDDLRARSKEIAPGIYEITRPGQDDKTRHHTPA